MIVNQTVVVPIKNADAFQGAPIINLAAFSSDPPAIYSIEHTTHYKYSVPITRSKHLFRLLPVQDLSQIVLKYKFTVSVNGTEISNFTGVFGNHASFLEIHEPYTEFVCVSESIVALIQLPRNMELAHQPRALPLIWMPWDRAMLQTYLLPPELPESELLELSEYAMSFARKNHNDAFEVLMDINQTIYNEFTYAPASTTFATTPYEVYFHKQGVCQDFANLLICLARLLDIPARYRVGYLYTGGEYENKIQADESHAWVEVFLPYMGWIGFDPTNGCLAEQNHIRVACGRYYSDATPTSGVILETEGKVQESLTTTVKVISINHQ